VAAGCVIEILLSENANFIQASLCQEMKETGIRELSLSLEKLLTISPRESEFLRKCQMMCEYCLNGKRGEGEPPAAMFVLATSACFSDGGLD